MQKWVGNIHIKAVQLQALAVEQGQSERAQILARNDVIEAMRLCVEVGMQPEHVFLAARQHACFQDGRVNAVWQF